MTARVTGWKLDPVDRARLLAQMPPAYGRVVADHVTLQAPAAPEAEAPPPVRAQIIGRADDGAGVEAMAVTIDGSSARPDGSIFHITWSLGPGREAVESNAVLKSLGFAPLAKPTPIRLTPAVWPRGSG